MEPVLEVRGIVKHYKSVTAVAGVSFAVRPGEILALLGPNGAGKTTILRILAGILRPDAGSVDWRLGTGGWPEPAEIGYLPEDRGLYRELPVLRTLTYFGALRGMPPPEATRAARDWLTRLDLADRADDKLDALSKGNQQKVQFIAAILHRPAFAILDEPFSGLDPVNVNLVKDILLELTRAGKTLVLSTHIMEQAEKLCERVCIIDKGRRVLDGNLVEIKETFGKNTVVLAYEGDGSFLEDPIVARKDDYGQYVEVSLTEGADHQHLLRRALESARVSRFEVVHPSLNDIFIRQVGEAP
jgi:ABC-2 type transport system ATP-binding protein